jgi:hypothetical protein
MRIEATSSNFIETPLVCLGKVIREGFVISGVFLTSVDGLYYISELALSIFALADKVAQHAPKALHRTVDILRGHPALHHTIGLFKGYMDFTCVLDIINRIKEWMSKDENEQYVWQRGLPTLLYYISLTISDLTNHLYLIDKFKFIQLGACAGPIGIIYSGATFSQQIFDAWTTYYELRSSIFKSEKSKVRHLQWQVYQLSDIQEIRDMIRTKAHKWETISQHDQSERVLAKKHFWGTMKYVKDDQELFSFVNSMEKRAAVSQKNCSIKVLTTYCSLVCTISYIALLILSAVVAVIALKELILATAILTVIVNAIYVGDFVIEHYFKEAALPDQFLPTTFCI